MLGFGLYSHTVRGTHQTSREARQLGRCQAIVEIAALEAAAVHFFLGTAALRPTTVYGHGVLRPKQSHTPLFDLPTDTVAC